MSFAAETNQVWYTGRPARRVKKNVRELIGVVGSNHAAAPFVSAAAAFPVRVRVAASHDGTSVARPVHEGLPTTPGAQ